MLVHLGFAGFVLNLVRVATESVKGTQYVVDVQEIWEMENKAFRKIAGVMMEHGEATKSEFMSNRHGKKFQNHPDGVKKKFSTLPSLIINTK